jgi:IS30 family transposase
MTGSEFAELDGIISPLVKRGQSLAHICASHANEIPVTERTVYNYFEQNLFTAINLDLPRKVRYKKRTSHKTNEPRDYAVREGRTYEDFQKHIAENPELPIVEMDTVEGRKGGKVLLTLLLRNCRLQLAFLMEHQTQDCVMEWFNWLFDALGEKLFSAVFGVILTDNGSEFLNPASIECDSDGVVRTRVFFCDPNCSYQKGMSEKNHEYIRYILPKGTSFDDLTQEDVNLLLNHINSSCRDSLNGKSPFETAAFLLPQQFLSALGFHKIPSDEILLKPQLLK